MTTPHLLEDLERDEGRRLFPYRDTRGFWTIGVGHNVSADPAMRADLPELERAGITQAAVAALLGADVARVMAALDRQLPWWRTLNDARQDVLVSLAFNLGEGELATWRHTLTDIEAGNFKAAAVDLEHDEPWAGQVKARAQRLAVQMETGERVT